LAFGGGFVSHGIQGIGNLCGPDKFACVSPIHPPLLLAVGLEGGDPIRNAVNGNQGHDLAYPRPYSLARQESRLTERPGEARPGGRSLTAGRRRLTQADKEGTEMETPDQKKGQSDERTETRRKEGNSPAGRLRPLLPLHHTSPGGCLPPLPLAKVRRRLLLASPSSPGINNLTGKP